jgi:Ca2+-binding EF-hand superfamily protein
MRSFLEKYNYFESVYFTKFEPTRDLIRNKSYQNNNITLNTKGLFPTDRLDESKIDKVLRDLRRNLEIKNIGFAQFFQMIDNDKDGFITIQEFSESIERVIPLSQYIKDGLFAYIDKLHIGMIDYTFFNKFLNKSVTYPEVKLK